MPILKREPDMYPENLLKDPEQFADAEKYWWCVYTMSRREKDLMRRLTALRISHFGPTIPRGTVLPQVG